jgi:SET domain-containing protein
MADIHIIRKFLEAIKKNNGPTEEINNFEVKESDIEGNGVFATKNIKSGDFINVALFKTDDDIYDTTKFGGMINHCNNPNCRTRFEGEYYRTYATKKISSGDEITADYRQNKTLQQPEPGWKDY